MFEGLKEKAKQLVTKHGSEVSAVAKIAAHALIPGAPLIVSSVEALCDYSSGKGQEADNATLIAKLEALGGDTACLEKILGHLTGQLDGVIGMMTQSSQFGATAEMMEAMINGALEQQFSALRDELRAITPELETIKRQQEETLRAQQLQGDMLHQVQDSIDAMLSYNAPLAAEGVVGRDVGVFLAARGRFEGALLSGALEDASQALSEMKRLSPHGNTMKVSEMALKAARRDFEGAEQVARTITGAGASNPRLTRARQSLTRLTQAARLPSPRLQPQQTPQLEAGATIGDKGWRLTALIGRGGMGAVWRAQNARGREGALKLMSASLSGDEGFVSRFRAEIDALDKVRHPAVVQILDWGCDRSGAWYFVMPFIEGSSLCSRLRRGAMEEVEVKALLKALAGGLASCHAEGVIHRDIKPENIMLKPNGAPVLIDFGIAHQAEHSTGETSMATGGYAPPEQLAGRAVDASADLFALGMTLAECLGPKAGEGEWRELIGQLTHFLPSARGTSQALLERFSEAPKKYHASLPGAAPEGPLSVPEVVARVTQGADQLHLWWAGASGWALWREVSEVAEAVERARPAPTPSPLKAQVTPPPPPPLVVTPRHKAGDLISVRAKGVEFKMAWCPAGEFWMGSEEGVGHDDERPRHRVKISKPFLMGQTQVTQALWEAVMGSNPSEFKGAQRPVEQVSWYDMARFCNALSALENFRPAYSIASGDKPDISLDFSANGYRMPTEAEWEYAAKAGTELVYAGSAQLEQVGWFEENSDDETHPVAQKKANAWGLHDMSGNVLEWCSDQWDENAYKSRPEVSIDPCVYASSPARRVLRGGSCGYDADNCRVASRGGLGAANRGYFLGGRLLRSNLDS